MDNNQIQDTLNDLKKTKKLSKYIRKQKTYEFMNVDYRLLKPYSYTILLKNTLVITKIDNKLESKIKLKRGDYVICGPKKEKYGLPLEKILNTYDLSSITNKPVIRHGFEIIGDENQTFKIIPSWGGTQNLKTGDIILLEQDKKKYYGVEKGSFKRTYKKLS